MSHGIYQLVAITKDGKEKVIELNNVNKNNRASLAFIDSGTTRFKNGQHLSEYLYKSGKITDEEVTFAIRYVRNGKYRYMPVIYDDSELAIVSKNENNEIYFNEYVYNFLKRIESEMYNGKFYYFIKSMNKQYADDKESGNYLNDKLMSSLLEYNQLYVNSGDIDTNKSELQYIILKELLSYKQLRTMYMYYKEYINYKENKINKTK